MAYENFEPLHKQLTIVVGLTVVGFMAFGLALSFYRNVLFEETLDDLRLQNELLKEKIARGRKDLEYYRSVQYKDKYAKENLGLIQPGENVLIITENTKDLFSVPAEEAASSVLEQREAAFLELLRQMPIIDHWKLFFFHRNKIEELKKSL